MRCSRGWTESESHELMHARGRLLDLVVLALLAVLLLLLLEVLGEEPGGHGLVQELVRVLWLEHALDAFEDPPEWLRHPPHVLEGPGG